MRMSKEQVDRLMNDERPADIRFCIHDLATDHECSPPPGYPNMHMVRMVGHTMDMARIDTYLNMEPSDLVPDADLMVIDLGMPDEMLKEMISKLVSGLVDQRLCEMRAKGQRERTDVFSFPIPKGVNPGEFMRLLGDAFPADVSLDGDDAQWRRVTRDAFRAQLPPDIMEILKRLRGYGA